MALDQPMRSVAGARESQTVLRSPQDRRTSQHMVALGTAAVWSALCAAVGMLWVTAAAPYPFGPDIDVQADLSILGFVDPVVAGWMAVTFGVAGVTLAFAMSRPRPARSARTWLLISAWGSAFLLAAVIPDYRLLVLTAYAPIFLIGAPLGMLPDGVSILDGVSPPVVGQAVSLVGGIAWAMAARSFARRWTADRCATCGRAWTNYDVARARRWGARAVAVAVVVPLFYAATRYAWAVGIPFGVSDEFLRQGDTTGMWVAGAALATLAVLGAILTVGLVARWGEVFPAWLPLIGSRPVPVMLAVAPALIVAALVTSAGLMFVRVVLRDGFERFGTENWGAVAPELVWPIWGVALAAAALAYRRRREGSLARCACPPHTATPEAET
jgi:hypothetical protein